MNIERFHNEIAMRLGYERFIKDKKISIHVEETHEPWVTLKVQGCHDEIRFKASDAACLDELKSISTMQDEVKSIIEAVRQAYVAANKPF